MNNAKTCRVLIVDDHPIIAETLKRDILSRMGGIEDDYAVTLPEAIHKLETGRDYQLVILDLHLQDTRGRETMAGLRERFPDVPVLVFSGDGSIENITMAFEHHARGFVTKTSPLSVISAAISLVLSGGTYVPPETARILGLPVAAHASLLKERPALKLSGRQEQVFKLLLQGMPNKVIASRLNLAEGTVKTHLNVVYRMLGVGTRVEAILKARALGLLS